MMTTISPVRIPPKLIPLWSPPRGTFKYRAMYGGRGSAKSRTTAKMVAIWGCLEKLRILCTREFQAAIKDSFHAEVKAAIASDPYLAKHYDVGVDYIKGANGTEFLFKGLRLGLNSIKSLANIDVTVVEEAEDVPEVSWLALEATVFRQPRSEMAVIWNPRKTESPVDKRFRQTVPTRAKVIEINYEDNPWFPAGLEELRQDDLKRLDDNTYQHIWHGAYLTNSESQVLNGKWRQAEFEPRADWDGPYFGGDFGYANDPMAAVEAWIYGDRLYVRREAGGRGVELDHIAARVKEAIPGYERSVSRWDSASPGSISIVKRTGLPRAEGAPKWPGSVEDGIRFLRSFREIVVHPECKQTINECRLYSYKVDRLTNEVRSDIVDAHNHWIDSLRYAVSLRG